MAIDDNKALWKFGRRGTKVLGVTDY